MCLPLPEGNHKVVYAQLPLQFRFWIVHRFCSENQCVCVARLWTRFLSIVSIAAFGFTDTGSWSSIGGFLRAVHEMFLLRQSRSVTASLSPGFPSIGDRSNYRSYYPSIKYIRETIIMLKRLLGCNNVRSHRGGQINITGVCIQHLHLSGCNRAMILSTSVNARCHRSHASIGL